MDINFTSKYEYVKSIKELTGLDDEEANTVLWVLDMWDKKREIDFPSDFKLNSIPERPKASKITNHS